MFVLPECVFYVQFVKCGFAGDNFPAAVFPCLVGRPMLRYEENLGDQELRVSS
jgi:actin-related protein 2